MSLQFVPQVRISRLEERVPHLWQGGLSKGGVQQHGTPADTAQGLDVGQAQALL